MTVTTPATEPRRLRDALRTLGRWVVEGLATDNGWCWGACYGYPVFPPAYRMRNDPRTNGQACTST